MRKARCGGFFNECEPTVGGERSVGDHVAFLMTELTDHGTESLEHFNGRIVTGTYWLVGLPK